MDCSTTSGLMLQLACQQCSLYQQICRAMQLCEVLPMPTLYTYLGNMWSKVLFAAVDQVAIYSWSTSGAFLIMYFAI